MKIAVIGGGPCGTYIAYKLSKYHKVDLYERESDLGGCWGTKYKDSQYFTEHSPRIMFNNYVNTRDFFTEIGIDFYEDFFKVFSVYGKSMKYKDKFTNSDLFNLTIGLLTPSQYWNAYTVKDMCNLYDISPEAVELIKKMCYGIDGVSYDKLSAAEYFETINYSLFSSAYEPRQNSDVYLIPKLKRALYKTNIYYNHKLDYFQTGRAFFETSSGMVGKKYDHYIICIPPVPFANVMNKSDFTLYKDPKISKIAESCFYTGIGIQYHFDDDEEYIFKEDTNGEWNIIATYNKQSRCLSCVVVDFDLKSKVLGLTVNQCSKNQIEREVWRQLKEVVDMKRYKNVTISENVFKKGDKYTSTQGSYYRNRNNDTIETDVGKNVSYVGSHNSHQFPFTSYESALQTAKMFLNKIEFFEENIPVYNAFGLKDTIIYTFFVILIFYYISKL